MAAVVHDNTWADVGFVVNYERVDDHVGPYSPKDVTDGWHHFTVAARRGTAAGPKGTSTLFVDGVMVARANAAAMCPLRSLGGHPNTEKGEITQDVGAIAGIEVFCNTALDSDAVNALFRDTLRPIAIAMDKEEGVTTHADGQLYGTNGLIFGAPTRERHPPGGLPVDLLERIAGLGAGLEQTKANVARFLLSAKRGVALAGVSAASARATVVRPRAAVPQPPVPLEALPHGFLRKQPTNPARRKWARVLRPTMMTKKITGQTHRCSSPRVAKPSVVPRQAVRIAKPSVVPRQAVRMMRSA